MKLNHTKNHPGKKAYVLDSVHLGISQQLHSLANALSGEYEVVSISSRLRSGSKLFRILARIGLLLRKKLGSQSRISSMTNKILLTYSDLELEYQDIVIAKTPSELTLALLIAGSEARSLFIGNPKKIDSKHLDLLISTPSTPIDEADIFLETPPCGFTYEEYLIKHNAISHHPKTWCLLLGGNASGYAYHAHQWESLINGIITLAHRYNIRWVISSSPRTGTEAELILRDNLSGRADIIHELVLWRVDDNRKRVVDCLAGAEVVFVSEDSVSMMSEALTTRLPVVSIRPEAEEPFYPLVTRFINHHADIKTLARITIANLGDFELASWIKNEFSPLSVCWSEALNAQLRINNHD